MGSAAPVASVERSQMSPFITKRPSPIAPGIFPGTLLLFVINGALLAWAVGSTEAG